MGTYPWQLVLAGLINGAGVFSVLWVFNNHISGWLRANTPWLIPILAAALGPVVALAQSYLAKWLGVPIDLAPLSAMALFSGASATAMHQVYKNAKA